MVNVIKESICRGCGTVLNRCDDFADGSLPKPGDVSICLTCNYVMIFDDDLMLREPTDDEAAKLVQDPRFYQATSSFKRH